jgi:hypothetical protein
VSDPLVAALEELVPAAPAETGDWSAVVAAAAERRRPSRRQLLVAFAALAVLATLVATPAFGVRSLILGLIGRTNVSFTSSPGAPNAIKLRFLEFDDGAPPGMAQHPLPDEAKSITFRGAGGQKHVLWIAPTRSGGFCTIGPGGGGCLTRNTVSSAGPVTIGGAYSEARGQKPLMRSVNGDVLSRSVATLTLDFADGTSIPLPFVYVSSPIDAGFYFYGVPGPHQGAGHWPVAVVARNAAGAVIGTKRLAVPTRPVLHGPGVHFVHQTVRLPAAGSVHPTAPLRQATASGVTAVAGANGAIRMTVGRLPPALTRLLGRPVTYLCFRLAHAYGIFTVLGVGRSGSFARSVGFTVSGTRGPIDGCEIDSSRGHRWPDVLGSHSPAEVAFTAQARAFFADRATARDLALFVRSGRMQRIRHEPRRQLLRDLKSAYGPALARSRIRYALTAHGITFTEPSTTGKVFRVVVVDGRIAHANVEPYAKVF